MVNADDLAKAARPLHSRAHGPSRVSHESGSRAPPSPPLPPPPYRPPGPPEACPVSALPALPRGGPGGRAAAGRYGLTSLVCRTHGALPSDAAPKKHNCIQKCLPMILYSAAGAGGASAPQILLTVFARAAILGPTMVSTTCPSCNGSGIDTDNLAGGVGRGNRGGDGPCRS